MKDKLHYYRSVILMFLFFMTYNINAQDCGAFPKCRCSNAIYTSFDILDCSGLGLTDIPKPEKQLSGDIIYEMRLNNNNITSLIAKAFDGMKIRKLDLRDNKISTVDKDAFEGLQDSLLYLYMDGNGTSHPPKDAWAKLIQLQGLTLRNYGSTNLSHAQDSFLFLQLQNLQELTLENWRLNFIETDALKGIASLQSLTLNKQELNAIPVDMLRENNLVKLKQLKISNTKIERIGNLAFEKLLNLSELDLSYNHIMVVEGGSFLGLSNSLKSVNLSGNILTSDASKLLGLDNLPNLSQLDLSNNIMDSIPNLSQIKTKVPFKLYLANNKIQQLNSDMIVMLGNLLHTMDLSNNTLNDYNTNVFSSTPSLVSLNVSNNRMTNNVWNAIKMLRKLEVLNLSNTELTEIPDFIFENLTDLRELDLSTTSGAKFQNVFSTISNKSLVGPHETLKGLYLSGTGSSGIISLPPCFFNGYTSFPITMSLGQVICNCDIIWLWQLIKNNHVKFLIGKEPTCNGNLLSAQVNSSFCSNPTPPSCVDYYNFPIPTLTLIVKETNITASWSLATSSNHVYLMSFSLQVDENNQHILSKNISSSIRSYLIPNLRTGTVYTVCITAVYNAASRLQCNATKTLSSILIIDNSIDIGLIVGLVIGGVVLLAIIMAIVYILFIRRRSQKKGVAQPRTFAKSELPTMTGESRSFAKPKKKVNSTDKSDPQMQVVAISNGHMGPPRTGRAQMLNSHSSEGKPRSTSSVSSSEPPVYENDRGALPKLPNTRPESNKLGYMNMAFKKDSYDEIDPNREISL